MKLVILTVLSVFSLFEEVYLVNLDNRLNVEILFESLCPDSLRFIKEQLHPNYRALAPYINLKLVPFGKSASIDGGTKFACQHGPAECAGNRVLSCALTRLTQDVQVEFTSCFMGNYKKGTDGLALAEHCSNILGLSFNDVANCYNTKEGTQHQLLAEIDTVRITPKFVPTVLYNGQFDQRLQDASLGNFKGVVCGFVKGVAANVC